MPQDIETHPATAQVTVTIQVSGDNSEVVRILDAVRSALAGAQVSGGRRPGRANEAAWWTPERASAFVRRLKPPALHALGTIAESAPNVRVSAVQREMQRAGLSMTPGALSSIGFAVRALGSPAPFVRDNYTRTYRMDPAVAAALLPAVQAERDQRPALNRRREEAADE